MKHVTFDLYGIASSLLESEPLLRSILADLPAHIGMQAVHGPVLAHIDAVTDPRDAGMSGFVIIATSHVSLHAWPPYGMLNLDVFSCCDFSTEAVLAFLSARLRFGEVPEVHEIERATRSPRPPTGGAATGGVGMLPPVAPARL